MGTQVFYATNRRPIGDATAAPFYGLDAVPGAEGTLRTGLVEITTSPEPEAARVVESILPDDAQPPGAVTPTIAAWAANAVALHIDAVLFIHGYGNTWLDSVARAAQLRDFYGLPRDGTAFPMSLLAFGWPSDGQVFPPGIHYPHDRADAAASAPAFAALIGQIAAVAPTIRATGLRLHLIAHSMGNWALRNGLAALDAALKTDPLFDEVVLAAADEDADALTDAAKLAPLARVGGRITCYIYPTSIGGWDPILGISAAINHQPRLGASWPVGLPAAAGRDDAAISVAGVIEALSDPNLTGHQYYRNNVQVRRDVISVLEGKPQAAIRGRLADMTAAAHSHLIGTVPAPPLIA